MSTYANVWLRRSRGASRRFAETGTEACPYYVGACERGASRIGLAGVRYGKSSTANPKSLAFRLDIALPYRYNISD